MHVAERTDLVHTEQFSSELTGDDLLQLGFFFCFICCLILWKVPESTPPTEHTDLGESQKNGLDLFSGIKI